MKKVEVGDQYNVPGTHHSKDLLMTFRGPSEDLLRGFEETCSNLLWPSLTFSTFLNFLELSQTSSNFLEPSGNGPPGGQGTPGRPQGNPRKQYETVRPVFLFCCLVNK